METDMEFNVEKKEIFFQSIINCINIEKYNKNHSLRTLHIAILFKGKKIIHIMKNDAKGIGTVHAEENLCKSFHYSDRYKILVIRIMPDGKFSNSRPCKRCVAILQQKGHKFIWYSTENGFCKERLDEIQKRPSSYDRTFPVVQKKVSYSF